MKHLFVLLMYLDKIHIEFHSEVLYNENSTEALIVNTL